MTAGIWNRYAAFGAGILFVVLMAGAVHAHIVRARHVVLMTIPAMICLIASTMITIWEFT